MNSFGQRFVARTLPTFENITEVFIWGFLAQDVVAMWLPRIYALLTEGRKKYDPKDDPSAKSKPFGTQFRKYVKGNLEGLNWDNFYEGTKREFATGPGLLMVPAAIYLAASRLANPAVKMPFPAVKGMSKGLKRHFEDANKLSGDEAYLKQVQDYVHSIFQDPKLTATEMSPTGNKKYVTLERLKAELARDKKDTTHIITDLSKWSEDWVNNFSQTDVGTKKKETQRLSKQLQETIRAFNRTHRMEKYEAASGKGVNVNRLIEDEHPLHRTESTWVSYQPKRIEDWLGYNKHPKTGELLSEEMQKAHARKYMKQMPVTEVLRDLTRMEGLAKGIEERATKNNGLLSDAAEQTMKHMVNMKFGMSLGATAVTAAYLTKLAFWAQNHNTYQATRLLNEKTAQNHGSQSTDAANARSHRAGQPQSIAPTAGSANALQPAFSMAARTQAQPFARPAQMPAVSPFAQPQPWPAAQADERRNA